jgi:hypothetical protein
MPGPLHWNVRTQAEMDKQPDVQKPGQAVLLAQPAPPARCPSFLPLCCT